MAQHILHQPPAGTSHTSALQHVLSDAASFGFDSREAFNIWLDTRHPQGAARTPTAHVSPHCILKTDDAQQQHLTAAEAGQRTGWDWCENCVRFADSSVSDYVSAGVADAWLATHSTEGTATAFSSTMSMYVPGRTLSVILERHAHNIIQHAAAAHPDNIDIARYAHISANIADGERVTIAFAGFELHEGFRSTFVRRIRATRLLGDDSAAIDCAAMLVVGLDDLYHLGRRRPLNRETLCASATPELATELTQLAGLSDMHPTIVADHVLSDAERQIAGSLHSEGRTATEAVEIASLIVANS